MGVYFRNVFENGHILATIYVYTNTCKGETFLYKHSLFIINIFITKLLEKRTPWVSFFHLGYALVCKEFAGYDGL